ncbi:MAG: T9SS type A sorting domain-containing protein [Flavobacteriales bacterium]
MKRYSTLIFLAFLSLQTAAQSGLDNLGFENWTENNAFGNRQPNGLGSIGQTENTSDPIEGGSALSLTTKRFQISATEYDTAGITLLGSITFNGVQLGGAYNNCPDSITGYIRYNLPNQDSGVIASQVWNSTDTLATADTLVGGSLSNWTSFTVPYDPINCGGMTPDSITMIFSAEAVLPEAGLDIGTQTPGMGSFELDGVELWNNGVSTSLSKVAQKKASFSLHPNPARERLRFEYGNSARKVRVYDMTGRNVRNVQLDQSGSESIDVSKMDAGLYIYRVEDQEGRKIYSDKLQILH